MQAESVYASVDPAKFERIVENLLANAERHTPTARPSRCPSRPNGRGALLRVDDRGPACRTPRRRRSSRPSRAEARSSRPGVGAGLALVAQFAALHGGRAWVGGQPRRRRLLPRALPGRRRLSGFAAAAGSRKARSAASSTTSTPTWRGPRRPRRLRRPRQGGAVTGGARRDRRRRSSASARRDADRPVGQGR